MAPLVARNSGAKQSPLADVYDLHAICDNREAVVVVSALAFCILRRFIFPLHLTIQLQVIPALARIRHFFLTAELLVSTQWRAKASCCPYTDICWYATRWQQLLLLLLLRISSNPSGTGRKLVRTLPLPIIYIEVWKHAESRLQRRDLDYTLMGAPCPS